MRSLRNKDRPMRGFEGVAEAPRLAFRALSDAMRMNGYAMSRRFQAQGAHMGQAACLRVLDVQDGMTQRDMAEFMHVSRPNITQMLQAVEKAGLVVRKTDETDQRLTRAYLTDEGKAAAAKLRAVLGGYINEVFDGMSEEDLKELTRLLGCVADNIERSIAKEKGDAE